MAIDEFDKERQAGEAVDLAVFGSVRGWTGGTPEEIESVEIVREDGLWRPVFDEAQGGWHIGLEWEKPRQVSSFEVVFDSFAPDPDSLKLQYWNHNWPAEFFGGWTAIDDPYNGQWVNLHGDIQRDGDRISWSFHPLDFTEIDKANDFAVFYRQTYRFRLLYGETPGPGVRGWKALSTSTWREAQISVDVSTSSAGQLRLTVTNGEILEQRTQGSTISACVLWADTTAQVDPKLLPIAPDVTVLHVQDGDETLGSFSVEDTLKGPVNISDIGISARADNAPATRRSLAAPVYDRVAAEPEQSLERASAEIPHLVKTIQKRYVPLGVDGNRYEFALRFDGNVFIDRREMKATSRDTARILHPGRSMSYRFPTMDPPDFRQRENGTKQSALDGSLPIYTSAWTDRSVAFEKLDFAALLYESMENPWDKRGNEPVCLFSRIRIRNTVRTPAVARFWMVIEQPESLSVDDGFVYASGRLEQEIIRVASGASERLWTKKAYTQRRLRARIETGGRGELSAQACSYEPFNIASFPNAILYTVELDGCDEHEIVLKVPVFTFVDDEGRDDLKRADFAEKLQDATGFWQSLIDAGASIHVPEEQITTFVRATLPHVAITADRDIKTGHYMLPAATYGYNVCANEAMHQVRSLDLRSHHQRARAYLEPYLACQSTRPLHGKFKTQEGVLHGLKMDEETDYQTFNYNLDHGFVLFALAEHFFLTRDSAWANSIAGNLISACDFVTRERRYTMKPGNLPDGKASEFGLLPPGHLEDNPEWLYWYAVNAYCYRGMEAAARTLHELGHEAAGRIKADAQAYRDDLRRSMAINMRLSPAAELLDGAFVPFTPTRARLYSRDLGWIRDSLYGPIHSIECGVLDVDEDQSTWILKDSEDNVFINPLRGRRVDIQRDWFSHGGNTIQSGLLPMVMVYVKRDQPEHAIRALFNAFAQNIYRDVNCFAEHPVEAFGLGVGPFYKTPDECCWVNWLRFILLSETGYDRLCIAPATPRAWLADGPGFSAEGMASYFGPLSFSVEPDAGASMIRVRLDPPRRNPPAALDLRLRHPEKRPVQSVTVNGSPWTRFDPGSETIHLDPRASAEMEIIARY